MDKPLYYTSSWIMSEKCKNYILFAFGIAEELECDLIALEPEGEQVLEDEAQHVSMTFILMAPSQARLDEFIVKISYRTGLTDWYPISETVYNNADRCYDDTSYLVRTVDFGARVNEFRKEKRLPNPINELHLSASVEQLFVKHGLNTLGDIYSYPSSFGFLSNDDAREFYDQLAKAGFDTITVISFIPFDESSSLFRTTMNRYEDPLPANIPKGRIPSCNELQMAASKLDKYKFDYFYVSNQRISNYCDVLVQQGEAWAIIRRHEFPKDDMPIVYGATGKYPVAKAMAQQIANICGAMFITNLGSITELVLPELDL